MKIHPYFFWITLFLTFALVSTACNLTAQGDAPTAPQVDQPTQAVPDSEPATLQPEQPTLEPDPTQMVENTPEVVVPPTRNVRRFNFNSSNEDGTCGSQGNVNETGDEFDCQVVFADGFPMEFKIFKNGQEIGREGGVQKVDFRVTQTDTNDNTNTIYENTENNAPYCIFGGDSICPPWTLEENVYKWEQGGLSLETGVYKVNIVASLDDLSVVLVWSADITVTSPN